MLIYFDSVIPIHLVDGIDPLKARAEGRLAALLAANDRIAASDLVRMECLVLPLRTGDLAKIASFDAFFARPEVRLVPFTPAVFDLAAEIRARHRFKTPDALHLAAAEAAGCDRLLTNDARLNAYTGRLTVEALP